MIYMKALLLSHIIYMHMYIYIKYLLEEHNEEHIELGIQIRSLLVYYL